jgi:hypothetical protein
MKSIKELIKKINIFKFYNLSKNLIEIEKKIDHFNVLLGKIVLCNNFLQNSNKLSDYEFKVFSQYEDDGIIQFLIKKTSITDQEKKFIEFGAQNYEECNTKFLLINNYWEGLAIEGNENHVKKIFKKDIVWKYNLKVAHSWITTSNVNKIFKENDFYENIGLLSIDIDGNDYWVWNSVSIINPVIVVIEWNSVFGFKKEITTPYNDNFDRFRYHHSGLCWGASISALKRLGNQKGYIMVGSNSAGNNLYFVRKDRAADLKDLTNEESYIKAIFSDSRDINNNLNYLKNLKKIKEIQECKVLDLNNNLLVKISELDL